MRDEAYAGLGSADARAGAAMFCAQCGTRAREGDRYCSDCGRLLGGDEAGEVASGGGPGPSWAGRGPPQQSRRPGAELTTLPGTEEVSVELAGFWVRLGGLAIDAAAWMGLAMAVWVIVMMAYFVANGFPEATTAESEVIPESDLAGMSLVVNFVVWTIVFGATWWFNAKGWTLGKRAVGLRIVGEDGRPPGAGRGMGRTFGAWLSWLPLGLGFLWAAWDKQGQTWHDKMAGTYVVRADSLRAHHDHEAEHRTLH